MLKYFCFGFGLTKNFKCDTLSPQVNPVRINVCIIFHSAKEMIQYDKLYIVRMLCLCFCRVRVKVKKRFFDLLRIRVGCVFLFLQYCMRIYNVKGTRRVLFVFREEYSQYEFFCERKNFVYSERRIKIMFIKKILPYGEQKK